MSIKKVLVINGPNINLLGHREPQIYGSLSLLEIEKALRQEAEKLKIEIEFFQSNSEGDIVSKIQSLFGAENTGLIINPAAYTHTSAAIRDAIAAVGVKTIEVHISNIYAREEFRHKSFIAPLCIGQISGLGADGYIFALKKLAVL